MDEFYDALDSQLPSCWSSQFIHQSKRRVQANLPIDHSHPPSQSGHATLPRIELKTGL